MCYLITKCRNSNSMVSSDIFWIISATSNFITNCDMLLSQSATGTTKCNKIRQLRKKVMKRTSNQIRR